MNDLAVESFASVGDMWGSDLVARSIRSRIIEVLSRSESLARHCVADLSGALRQMAETSPKYETVPNA